MTFKLDLTFTYNNIDVHVTGTNNKPRFNASDIGKCLRYKKPRVGITHHLTQDHLMGEGPEESIDEIGLFIVLDKSTKREKPLFKKWLINNALPTIYLPKPEQKILICNKHHKNIDMCHDCEKYTVGLKWHLDKLSISRRLINKYSVPWNEVSLKAMAIGKKAVVVHKSLRKGKLPEKGYKLHDGRLQPYNQYYGFDFVEFIDEIIEDLYPELVDGWDDPNI